MSALGGDVLAGGTLSGAPLSRQAGRRLWPGWGRVIILALTALLALAVLTPLLWAVLGSLKTEADYRAIPVHVLPSSISFQAYEAVLADGDLPRGFVNSIIVSGLEVAGVLLTRDRQPVAWNDGHGASTDWLE